MPVKCPTLFKKKLPTSGFDSLSSSWVAFANSLSSNESISEVVVGRPRRRAGGGAAADGGGLGRGGRRVGEVDAADVRAGGAKAG